MDLDAPARLVPGAARAEVRALDELVLELPDVRVLRLELHLLAGARRRPSRAAPARPASREAPRPPSARRRDRWTPSDNPGSPRAPGTSAGPCARGPTSGSRAGAPPHRTA